MNCIHCGACCFEVKPDNWTTCSLNKEQIEQLLEERTKHWRNPQGCDMRYMKNGKDSCLITIMFGKEFKPSQCQDCICPKRRFVESNIARNFFKKPDV